MQIHRREFRIAGLVALAALGVCQVGQGADNRGTLLERIRTSRTISNTNNSNGTSAFASRRAKVTPLGVAQTGTTVIQPQRVMSFGPADIATGVENSVKKQLDPNAGHTLGKRKKKPGGTTSASSGLTVGSKYDPAAGLSRAGADPNAGKTLGKRKKKPSTGGTTTTPPLTGGAGQMTPAPQNPAPQNPAPQTPVPGPAPSGGIGYPWPDVAGTVIPYVVNRTPIYETPVYVTSPAPVVEEVIVNEPVTAEIEQTPMTAGADLVLEDIKCAAPETILAGPAYEVTFRNQSQQAVGAFRVTIVVSLDNKPAKDAPKAVLDIAGMEAGAVGKATLRLPIAAMKMKSAGTEKPTAFSHLDVMLDSESSVRELDETNNHSVIERAALEPDAE